MAVQIVVLLEVVDVGHQYRERRSHPQIAPPFDAQRLVEATPVGDSGQAVDLAQLREVLLRQLELQVREDARTRNAKIDRLRDVIDGAELESVRLALLVAHAGHENDGNVTRGLLLFQQGADFVAVEARHHHIEQNEIRRFLVARNGERGFAVGCDANAEIVAQTVDQQLQVNGLVVRDQQQRRPRRERSHDRFASGRSETP